MRLLLLIPWAELQKLLQHAYVTGHRSKQEKMNLLFWFPFLTLLLACSVLRPWLLGVRF